jgi:hypothetical protein
MKQPCSIVKIISGGQTGADFGGLLAGKELGLKTGGIAPIGYRTESGSNYELKELGLEESNNRFYSDRTIKNVRNSDGTVIFGNSNSVGSKSTIMYCKRFGKPHIINPDSGSFQKWVSWNNIKILNVAGNRESVTPGICEKVKNFLITTIKDMSEF